MSVAPTTINKAVREILDKMVRELPQYRWESMCTYSDGLGMTVIEINIYRGGGSERMGRVAYHLETGDILNYRYRGYDETTPESILDMILDIVNLENSRALDQGQ